MLILLLSTPPAKPPRQKKIIEIVNVSDSCEVKGNQEFIMLDQQKVVYEEILDLSRKAIENDKKKVMIVKGGPGTGKTVVAINLLAQLTLEDQFCQYVSKNSAPRNVYQKKLKEKKKKSSIDNLFRGSGSYVDSEENLFDTLICD